MCMCVVSCPCIRMSNTLAQRAQAAIGDVLDVLSASTNVTTSVQAVGVGARAWCFAMMDWMQNNQRVDKQPSVSAFDIIEAFGAMVAACWKRLDAYLVHEGGGAYFQHRAVMEMYSVWREFPRESASAASLQDAEASMPVQSIDAVRRAIGAFVQLFLDRAAVQQLSSAAAQSEQQKQLVLGSVVQPFASALVDFAALRCGLLGSTQLVRVDFPLMLKFLLLLHAFEQAQQILLSAKSSIPQQLFFLNALKSRDRDQSVRQAFANVDALLSTQSAARRLLYSPTYPLPPEDESEMEI
jgi:hypothetical protein